MAYVYRHIRLDKNEPFYIGIGKNKYRHSAKQNRNNLWYKIVSKTDYEVEILFDNIDWETACVKEIEFIKLYGRIDRGTGTLANMTDGGDGNLGLIHSKQNIEKITKSSIGRPGFWKGKKMSDETRLKMSISKSGKNIKPPVVTKEMREALKIKNTGNKYRLGKKHTEESKRKMSESKIGRTYGFKKAVNQLSLDGKFIKSFNSITEASAEVGVCDVGIIRVCMGKQQTSKGYLWKYK